MVGNVHQILDSISSLLQVKFPKDTSKDQSKHEVISTIFELMKSTENLEYIPKNRTETAEIQQWIEYGIVYGAHLETQQNISFILTELNNILATKTYLAAPRITVADAFIYHVLLKTMGSLSNLEKEKFLNVCRWFDTVQDRFSRKKSELVDFSSIYLATLVPARH
nr:eukaryotic translation elongation factor 1 epsilon-1 [Leptinotarsa decemlineata]